MYKNAKPYWLPIAKSQSNMGYSQETLKYIPSVCMRGSWSSYFFIAVIKCHNIKQKNWGLFWLVAPEGLEYIIAGTKENKQQTWWQEWGAERTHLRHKHKVERINWKE